MIIRDTHGRCPLTVSFRFNIMNIESLNFSLHPTSVETPLRKLTPTGMVLGLQTCDLALHGVWAGPQPSLACPPQSGLWRGHLHSRRHLSLGPHGNWDRNSPALLPLLLLKTGKALSLQQQQAGGMVTVSSSLLQNVRDRTWPASLPGPWVCHAPSTPEPLSSCT